MLSGRYFFLASMLFVIGCGSSGTPEPVGVVDAEPEVSPPPYHVYAVSYTHLTLPTNREV